MLPASRIFSYRVGADDRIQLVSDAWLAFAVENGAPELGRETVCGARLWDFVSGAETRQIYELLFERARRTLGRYVIPFRCDAPEEVRRMELILVGLPDGSLDLTTTLVSSQSRPTVPLLDPNTPRTGDIITMCSWCKRVQVGPEEWVEVEEAVARLGVFESLVPRISHGMCGGCAVHLEAS